MTNYTSKEERFCLEVATGVDESGRKISYSEAYRRAYNAEKMADKTINEKASVMMAKDKIKARVKKLTHELAKEAMIGVKDLIEELEQARQAALGVETPQSSAAVAATMGKAKLLGLDKQVIDHISSDNSMTPKEHSAAVLSAIAAKHDTK